MNTLLMNLLMVSAMITWGESWISAKVLTQYATSDQLVFWRFFLTWASFLPVMILLKVSFRMTPRGYLLAGVCSLLLLLYNKMFFTGLLYGHAGSAGVLVTTLVPLLTFMLYKLIKLERIDAVSLTGLIVGICGSCIILEVWKADMAVFIQTGNVYFVIAAMCWAVMTIASSSAKKYSSVFTFSFYLFLFTSLLELVFIMKFNIGQVSGHGFAFWSNILLISVCATTYGTTVYFLGTSRLGSDKASSFIFLVPATALFFSWVFLGEAIKLSTVVGGMMAIFAVYAINKKKAEVKV